MFLVGSHRGLVSCGQPHGDGALVFIAHGPPWSSLVRKLRPLTVLLTGQRCGTIRRRDLQPLWSWTRTTLSTRGETAKERQAILLENSAFPLLTRRLPSRCCSEGGGWADYIDTAGDTFTECRCKLSVMVTTVEAPADAAGEPWPTAAIPIENRFCSCKLTRVRPRPAQTWRAQRRTQRARR